MGNGPGSMREKKRYLTFEIISKAVFDLKTVKRAIGNSMLGLYGKIGTGKAGLIFLDFNESKGVLRVDRSYVDELKVALMTIKRIDNKEVIVKSVRVSGLLHKAREV